MIKRYFRILLCALCSFFICVSGMGGITPVHGESAFLDTTTMKIGFDFKGHHSDHEGFITLNGQVAFCADYYTKVGFKKTYHSVTDGYKRYDEKTLKKLRTLAYYGYGYNGDKSYEMYMATQAAIWETIHGGEVTLTPYRGDGNIKNKHVDVNYQQAASKLNGLRALMNRKWQNFGTTPNLASSYMLKGVGDHHVLSINDPRGTLEDYDLVDHDGLDVSKNGNSLNIKATQPFTGKKTLRFSFHNRNNGTLNNSQPILYISQDYQDVVRLGFMYNSTFSVDVEMRQGQIEVLKKDTSTKQLISSPATFRLFDEYGKLAASLTTKDGSALSPLLPEGNYTLEETHAPDGYIKTSKIEINADFTKNTIKTVEAFNDAIKGSIHIDKNVLFHKDVDLSLINHDLSSIAFTLSAQEDILSPDNQKVIYKKGTEIGTYHLSKDGKLDIDQLALGKYVLKETQSPAHFATNKESYIFDLKHDSEKKTVIKKNVTNQPTIMEISKKALTGEDELPGAILALYDQQNHLIDQWTSTTKPHRIEGLSRHMTYKLVEVRAPKGYVISSPITFTIEDHANMQKFVMKDKQLTVSKQSLTGEKELPGASLEVLDEKGKAVDSWVSGHQPHFVNGLIEGKSYVLREKQAPNDYVVSKDIKFIVSSEKSLQKVVMKDKQLTVSKQSVTGEKEVAGAKLAIYDEEGREVEAWTSTNEPHLVSHLTEGKSYILKELEAPEGYVLGESVTFTVNTKKEQQKVVMKNKQVLVSKQDLTKKEELAGAKLSVLNEKGEVVDEWISTNTPHAIRNLKMNQRYILREILSPDHYAKSEDIPFTITDKLEDQHLTMYDRLTKLKVYKTDTSNKDLKGAKLQIIDEEGHVADEWLSNGEVHITEGLILNKKYVLREVSAPKGYKRARDMSFTMLDGESITLINEEEKVVKTSDSTSILSYAILLCIALIGILIVMATKKLKKRK